MADVSIKSPFPPDQVPRIWMWMQPFKRSVMDDYAPQTMEEFVRDWAERERNGQRSWVVNRDGERGGVIFAGPVQPGVLDIHSLFKKDFWGRDTTLQATEMACAELFEQGARKLMCTMFSSNKAIIALAKLLGGVTEGRLYSHTMVEGKPVDVEIVAIHKARFMDGVSKRRLQFAEKQRNEQLDEQRKFDEHGQHVENPHPLSIPDPEPAILVRQHIVEQPDADIRAGSSAS